MNPGTRTYNAIAVHRKPSLETALVNLGLLPGERLAVAESFWVLNMERAQKINFLLVHSGGRFINAAAVLDVEAPTTRDLAERPGFTNRVRFITSHHIPIFVESLLDTEIPTFLGHRGAKYARLLVSQDLHTAELQAPEEP